MDLQKILSEHAKWLADPSTGARADLQNADLRYANLRYANLPGADLRDADLRNANLLNTDLRNADLQGAYLLNADLQGANLQGAYLRGADLRGANLRDADLRGAYLLGADLRNADLRGAIGLVYLTQTDAGYSVLAQQPEPEAPWRIRAGCRDFSIDEAIAHWSSPDYHTPSSGRRCVAAIEWFRKETER